MNIEKKDIIYSSAMTIVIAVFSLYVTDIRTEQLNVCYKKFGEFADMIKKGDPNSGSVADPDKIITLRSK